MAKKAAYGTRLRYQRAADPASIAIRQVADISGPEIMAETIDVTTHDSRDHFNEFVPGAADGGEVTFDLIFDAQDGGHEAILDMVEDRALVSFSLFIPRPDTLFITDPDIDTGTGWVASAGWTITGGQAVYLDATPGLTDDLTWDFTDLAIGEEYLGEFVAGGTEGDVGVYFGGLLVYSFDASIPATHTFRATATGTTSSLVFRPTQGIAADFFIESAQVTGFQETSFERFDFTGLFTKAGILAPVKGALTASVGVKVSGAPVYEPAEA